MTDPIPAKLVPVSQPELLERIAQITAHRGCCGSEHDPANGKLHGYCVVCGVPWPCAYAGKPPEVTPTASEAREERDVIATAAHLAAPWKARAESAERKLKIAEEVLTKAEEFMREHESPNDNGPDFWECGGCESYVLSVKNKAILRHGSDCVLVAVREALRAITDSTEKEAR